MMKKQSIILTAAILLALLFLPTAVSHAEDAAAVPSDPGSPASVSAVRAGAGQSEIASFSAAITPAVTGAYPDYVALIPENAGYHLYRDYDNPQGVYWYDRTEGRIIQAYEVFLAGHAYTVNLLLEADSGYGFPGTCGGTLNGTAGSIERVSDTLVRVSRTWVASGGLTGWYRQDGFWFYNDTADEPCTGFWKIGGKWYYFNASGGMQTGYQFADGMNRYFDPKTGAMVRGWTKVGEVWHYADAYGVFVRGWRKLDGLWYYFDGDTAMVTGWQVIGGKRYYFNASGAMATGWKKTGGSWYFFTENGYLVSGWKQIDGSWYFFNSAGVMQTGWKTLYGKTYYLKPSGAMAANEWCGGYWLNADGRWTYPYRASWKQDSRGWRYIDTGGWYARNASYVIDGKTYTFNASGYLIE